MISTSEPSSSISECIVDQDAAFGLIEPVTALVAEAGAAILAINQNNVHVTGKSDGSPVTAADLAADRIIVAGLKRLMPDIPIVSEECLGTLNGPFGGSFFLVDPLDGTKEFITGHNDYTVNVALITRGEPMLGVVGAPALGLIWRGLVGRGAERLASAKGAPSQFADAVPIHTRPFPESEWIAAVSRSHADPRTEAFIAGRAGAVRQPIGSALKFCRVAEGTADIYPRLSPISEWDIAAGHAVVVAAGGKVTDSQGRKLRFGQKVGDFLVPEFIACGDPGVAI
jgi:3'(2'), 5'-bisphosphate nucleotidase